MRILILGGHGFIGCQVSNLLSNIGYEVAIVDNHENYNDIPEWEFQELLHQKIVHANANQIYNVDITDNISLDRVFESFIPNVVIHLGTYANAHVVKKNPTYSANNMINSTINIIELCKKHNVYRFVFASSSMVYGNFSTAYENQKGDPNTLYGSFKLQGEYITKILCSNYNIEWVILRPSAVYGYPDVRLRVISKMVDKAIEHKKIKVMGNENLDFTWVGDLANYFVKAATVPNAANQIFNATRGRARNLLEVAEIIKKHIGGTIELVEKDMLYPSRGTLNSDKIINMLHYTPQVDIEYGIEQYINWFLNQDYYKNYYRLN
jgi:UDP-glucuronate 4-epimerase